MDKDLIIYGAGGMGKECVWIAEDNQLDLKLKAFYDDNKEISSCSGIPSSELLNQNCFILVSVAEPKNKQKIVLQLKEAYRFSNLISNSAQIHKSSKLGLGCIVGFECIISVDVQVSNHCLINARTIIGHDSILGNFVSLMYNVSISGNVSIGEGTLIGTGAVILPNIKIGKWCKIGAGAVVTKDIPDYSVVVGVPGKIIKQIAIHE
jgi:acetyltransferase EpsM